MALEIIKNIAEAEQKSDTIKNQALQDAEKLKVDSENEGKEIFAKTCEQARISSTKIIQDAVQSAKSEIDSILEQSDNNCNAIKSKASEKMSEAVNAIIRKVVGADGNS